MIYRQRHNDAIKAKFRVFPIVAVLGPRQIGKTTLATQIGASEVGSNHTFDLESDRDLNRLSDNPEFVLGTLSGLVIIDEIQRRPDLFPTLRVLVDRNPGSLQFLVLGSASPELLQQSSETLAGRITYHYLNGLGLDEIDADAVNRRWLRGGFPKAYLARTNSDSFLWLESFIQTFLNRDVPSLGLQLSETTLRRFWTMLAHSHGNVWNASAIARSFGLTDMTIRRYLDVFSGALAIRQLQPWVANIKKRQVKSPKIYFRDSGLLHALLGINGLEALYSHPVLGASWEGFLIDSLIDNLELSEYEVFFWGTHTGGEIDLIVQRGTTLVGIEIKRSTLPKVTRSIHNGIEDLGLAEVVIIHAGEDSFQLSRKVRAVSAYSLLTELAI